ncbi:hypothetical protein K2173_019414 [Erythroxylum novogranatense]|uniref:Laccase n=1 Tax=Erythroxylum novogranatense TaxID=1862640 RepID=A0AAV8UB50_9ROSI|nr:hypothetical protein K2173_019414 [Erythroxylum novogranatense]
MSRPPLLLLACALALLSSSMAAADIVEHTFEVKNLTVRRLCNEQVVTAVNGSVPGPTIRAREGDTLVVKVINNSPYNITIHCHGFFQLLSGWADGPNMVTQCPIQPGRSYTYRFKIIDQEGTLWWHAHVSVLRASVHGALVIRPRSGTKYPFTKPYREVPVILGEWWKADVVDLEKQALATGAAPNVSDAYTINGRPGDLYNCTQSPTYRLNVIQGKTYLLRIINAALNTQLFFKVANHSLRVVDIDAAYTDPYNTDVVVTGPGQTVDALLTTDQAVGSYYMAASPYASAVGVVFNDTTTRGLLVYNGSTSTSPIMSQMPAANDTPTAHTFFSSITGLAGGPHWVPVPTQPWIGIFGARLAASMNNHSFQPPTTLSMLQAFFFNVSRIYAPDFPDNPPVVFDYTNDTNSLNTSLIFTPKSTSVTVLKYNATVEMVLQNTALIGIENHPIHIHGFNFRVLAQGFGNYDPFNDPSKFNLVNPQVRNTIGVPAGGWAVIRFIANNPGVWLMHCHMDLHLPWGLASAFVVQNGPTSSSRLPPPPADFPQDHWCGGFQQNIEKGLPLSAENIGKGSLLVAEIWKVYSGLILAWVLGY